MNQPSQEQQTEKQNRKTDVVIFLGHGSPFDNMETRYCLRSFEKHFKDLGRVFIVGTKPWWARNVVHVPHTDGYQHCKDANLLAKMVLMASTSVSNVFIRASDDQVVCRDVASEDFKPYILEEERTVGENILKFIRRGKEDNKWVRRMWHTHQYLKNLGHTGHNYEGHIPYPILKNHLPSLLNHPFGDGLGFTVNSLYFNTMDDDEHPMLCGGVRGNCYDENMPRDECEAQFEINKFVSYNNKGMRNKNFRSVLEEKFPEPSQYEEQQDNDIQRPVPMP